MDEREESISIGGIGKKIGKRWERREEEEERG